MAAPEGESSRLGEWIPFLTNYARALIDRRWQSQIRESDLVQKTMVDALDPPGTFERLPPNERRSWLLSILRNNLLDAVRAELAKCRDLRRRQSLEKTIEGSAIRLGSILEAKPDQTPEECESQERRMLALAAALARLPDEQRRAVTLRYFDRLTVPEIAARMRIAPRDLTLLIARTVRQLKLWLNP
jgi:RNA polymerase sigma factor (sigma-70 family)